MLDELEQRKRQSEEALKKLTALRAEAATAKSENGEGALLSRVRQAETLSAAADAARTESFATVEAAREQFKAKNPYVAVLERPTPASENVEDWQLPIAVGAIEGGLLGAALGLLLGLILVRPAPPPLPPTA